MPPPHDLTQVARILASPPSRLTIRRVARGKGCGGERAPLFWLASLLRKLTNPDRLLPRTPRSADWPPRPPPFNRFRALDLSRPAPPLHPRHRRLHAPRAAARRGRG